MQTATFLRRTPVFTLEQFSAALEADDTSAARERLKYHASQGRVKSLERGLYATVPPGLEPDRYQPDAFLAARAVRPDAIFSHHAALELLGAAHSDWNVCTVFTERRRRSLDLGATTVQFLRHPAPFQQAGRQRLGTRRVDRSGTALTTTGPERVLVDGFRQPRWVGGLPELVESASGFGVLDLELLFEVLEAYGQKTLWSACGWFLERYQRAFHVSDQLLANLEARRPRSPVYLDRSRRGGTMDSRWNLVVPDELVTGTGPDER